MAESEKTTEYKELKKKSEKIISILVMEKFFSLTNQKKSSINFFS